MTSASITNSIVYDIEPMHSVHYSIAIAVVIVLSFIIYPVAFELAWYTIRVWMSVAHVSMHGFSGSVFVDTKEYNTNKWQGKDVHGTLTTREMK
jgi:hypothetical protein